jgi:hypothetical protein
MSDQRHVDLEMRLAAIEHLLMRVHAIILVTNTPDQQTLERGLDRLAEHAAGQMFPGLNAALSDHATDEFGRAVRRLLEGTKAVAAQLRAP